jgi:hypothetical protein
MMSSTTGSHAKRAKKTQNEEHSGYLIIAIPDSYWAAAGEITFSFSLCGENIGQSVPIDHVFPKSVFAHNSVWRSEGVPDRLELGPGETKVLFDEEETLTSPNSPTADGERELVRYVLTVTGLKDARLPSESHPGIDKSSPSGEARTSGASP